MFNEKVYFEQVNGKQIFCDFSEPENPQKKIVIMSHGFRGSSTGPARTFVDFQRILNKEGFSVLRFDQPNSGNSEDDYLETSYNEWVDTITYFAKKYLDEGYKVALLGQSMGGATTVILTSRPELKDKIPVILLWVPGVNEGDFNGSSDEIFEEAGQKYKGKFWMEAREANFFKCINDYKGGIHLVYGEKDRYISQALRDKVIKMVGAKDQQVKILKNQDHSPWEYDLSQEVYKEDLEFLNRFL
ncbi:MAG: Prolyl oligopeptidase family protein [Candidatus Curtissbacteria bacterium GW2011_GWA1_40_16]|uniref:Prolyl oligopeptidase family protein n=1 Tax=Candidatus Curtissbacteria bacterium GW2011_GWA1_40_16 TaxID=1618405 RepID=A0A0G0RIT1_9BACT|nr:MAG: Prolyl oligopeptidase family protein [Candidatus Curtissbacteria bacterium GW2011_GWA1_40_16]